MRVVLLMFPPHKTHKMQPLDWTVFGPFEVHYKKATHDWMNSPAKVGKPVTKYDIAKLAGKTFKCAFTH
jgi:hypothetical protein